MNNKNLKSQVGIFIVVGVILMIGIVFLISTNFDDINIFSDQKSTYVIKEYVESCLDTETETAVKMMGLQGGWLYSKPMIQTNRISTPYLNKIATGINYLERIKMPYWYYYDDKKEVFKTNIPDYDSSHPYSIRNQIKMYLDENLEKNCIQSFRSFEDMYEINYEPREIKTNVVMQDKKISISLNLPLEITEITTGKKDNINLFKKERENPIYLAYHLAKDIIAAEIGSSFVEKRMMQILGPYQSSNGRELLPPQYDFRMTHDFEPWDLTKTEKLVKNIISSEIRRVQFLNTDYTQDTLDPRLQDSEFAKNFNSIYTRDYLSQYSLVKENNSEIFEKFKSMEVRTTYEVFYPMYFNIENGLGGKILLPSPQSVLGFLPIFFTEYVASYEITSPIIFEIKSNDIEGGFIFNLPIEANIKHNVPLRENIEFSFDLAGPKDDDVGKTLICNKAQFISEMISLNITDSIDYGRGEFLGPTNGVDEAIVTFTCKNLVTCPVTTTKINGAYEDSKYSELNFRLPIDCEPGTLEIKKFGHQKIVINDVNPTLTDKINLGTYEMSSPKEMKLKVKLKEPGQTLLVEGRDFEDVERGFIIFEHQQTKDFVRAIEINAENQYDLSVELIPGNYSIMGIASYEDLIIIEAEQICYKKGLFSGKDCTTIPEMNMSSWMVGGIEYENFEVENGYLLRKDTINVDFVDYGIPSTYSELEMMGAKVQEGKNKYDSIYYTND